MGMSCKGCPNDKPNVPRYVWPEMHKVSDGDMLRSIEFYKKRIEEITEILERWKPC
jgi:hypothetical protein